MSIIINEIKDKLLYNEIKAPYLPKAEKLIDLKEVEKILAQKKNFVQEIDVIFCKIIKLKHVVERKK